MTIAAITSAQQFARNGVTTQWGFNNKVFAASDLVVTDLDASVPPVRTVLVLNTDYTVANVDVDTGCTITTTVPGINGHTLDVRTITPEIQSTSIKNQGSFFPELHEEFFDRATRMLQDLQRLSYTYGIHGPDIESAPWAALPISATRANKLIGFDSSGQPTTYVQNGVAPGSVTDASLATSSQIYAVNQTYVRTAAEISAGVTPTNYGYPPGDVRRYGAVGNGVANDTSAITTALSCNSIVLLTAGATYLIGGITIPANTTLCCVNGRANITQTSVDLTAITIAANDIQVFGLNLNGGSVQTYQGGATSAGGGYGITISGAGSAVYDVTIRDCDLINFNNTAINVGTTAAAASYGKSANFLNVRAYGNRTNWFFGSNAEYCKVSNCYGTIGMYGVRLGGGNNLFSNCGFEVNYYNCYLETATNPQHGAFSACSFNHGGLRSLYATGVTLGMEFVGCKFWYGSIEIVNSNGIRICNGQLASSGHTLIVDGTSGGMNWIHDNMVFGTYTKTFTVSKLYWARNQLVGDCAATTKDNFVPNYYVRQHLTGSANLVNAAVPGTFTGLTIDEGWLHGITDTTNTVGSGFFKFPESGLYQISGRYNTKPHAGATEQLVTVTLRVVNAGVVEQTKFVVTRTMSATSTGEDLTFCDTFFAQAGWFLGVYVNTSLGANGLDTQSADIVVQSLA